MAWFCQIEIVIIDKINKEKDSQSVSVHAKYGERQTWEIHGIPADVVLKPNYEMRLSSLEEDVARDKNMMDYIHLINIYKPENFENVAVLFRNKDETTYRKLTKNKAKGTNYVNTALAATATSTQVNTK